MATPPQFVRMTRSRTRQSRGGDVSDRSSGSSSSSSSPSRSRSRSASRSRKTAGGLRARAAAAAAKRAAASTPEISSGVSASPSPSPKKAAAAASTRPLDNPRTTRYEFGGPLGALALVLGMPATVVALNALCTRDGCPNFATLSLQAAFPPLADLVSGPAMLVYLGWVAWCAAMYRVMPGKYVHGVELRNGTRLMYKINGFNTLLFTAAALALIVNFHGPDLLVYVADNFMPLVFSAILFSYSLSLVLYLASFKPGKMLALGGNSGNPIYDFFIGRELNPRIGRYDLKFFFELRPGLMGWILLNVAFLAKQYTAHGYITDAMLLVALCESLYVIDSLYNEPKVLTTMDITTDGFGFMLVAGDILWVPFLYSLQARYLSLQPAVHLGWTRVAAIAMLNFLGYWIFRSANSQKDAFRSGQSPHLEYMTTKSGSKLLVSGWWGTARHINYFGDWLMAVAWSLPCGFADPIPYFYPVYFAILLIHRFYRDEHKCRQKYGADWDTYCARVPWRIIPYVF